MLSLARAIAGLTLLLGWQCTMASGCGRDGVHVQVFGPADTDIAGTVSSYLIWFDGKARVLVNTGAGSAMSFARSGARTTDLDVILFTELHVASSADLPWLIQFSLPENRSRPLPIYGPDRSKLMPSTVTFVRTLFDTKRGVYRYLGELLSPLGKQTYKLQPRDVKTRRGTDPTVYRDKRLHIRTTGLVREPIPALAWRVELGGKTIVFSGNRAQQPADLERFAKDSELLIVNRSLDQVIPGGAQVLAPPAIAKMASSIGVRQLALTSWLAPTDSASQLRAAISGSYSGAFAFPAPMDCLTP